MRPCASQENILERETIIPHIYNCCRRWRCVVSFWLRSIYYQWKSPRYPWVPERIAKPD